MILTTLGKNLEKGSFEGSSDLVGGTAVSTLSIFQPYLQPFYPILYDALARSSNTLGLGAHHCASLGSASTLPLRDRKSVV